MLIPLFLLLLLISIHPFDDDFMLNEIFLNFFTIFLFQTRDDVCCVFYYCFFFDLILCCSILYFFLIHGKSAVHRPRYKKIIPTKSQSCRTTPQKNLKSISIVVHQKNRKSILNSFHNIGRSIVVWCFLALCAEICGAFLFLK